MPAFRAGDWFAIPLRFGLFALGRAAAVDPNGVILGYFFGRFFERLPSGTEVLALTPGDADIIGVCDQHGLQSGEWPRIATGAGGDPRDWPIPIFRTLEPASGDLRWFTPVQGLLVGASRQNEEISGVGKLSVPAAHISGAAASAPPPAPGLAASPRTAVSARRIVRRGRRGGISLGCWWDGFGTW